MLSHTCCSADCGKVGPPLRAHQFLAMNLLSCHVLPRWMMLPRESNDIQTIASNRITGCGAPLPKRIGFAFYVNSWMSSDLKLKVRQPRTAYRAPVAPHIVSFFGSSVCGSFADSHSVLHTIKGTCWDKAGSWDCLLMERT